MTINQRVRAWRQYVGMSVPEVAKRLEITPAAIYQWEADPAKSKPTTPSTKNLGALVEVLGVSLATFYGAVPARKKAS